MSAIIQLTPKQRRKLQKIADRLGYREYVDEDVIVRECEPLGRGVFAARRFTPGELIIAVGGQLIASEAYDGSDYVMEFDDGWFLEPNIPGCFLNHSCNPNAELVTLTDTHMGVVATCNIEPGRAVTFDYAWDAFEGCPECRCGSKNCRGYVVAADQVKKMRKIAQS